MRSYQRISTQTAIWVQNHGDDFASNIARHHTNNIQREPGQRVSEYFRECADVAAVQLLTSDIRREIDRVPESAGLVTQLNLHIQTNSDGNFTLVSHEKFQGLFDFDKHHFCYIEMRRLWQL